MGYLRTALALSMLSIELQMRGYEVQRPRDLVADYSRRLNRPVLQERAAEAIAFAVSVLLEMDVAERRVPVESRLRNQIEKGSRRSALLGLRKSAAHVAALREAAALERAAAGGSHSREDGPASGAGASDSAAARGIRPAIEGFAAGIAEFAPDDPMDESPVSLLLRRFSERVDVFEAIEGQVAVQLMVPALFENDSTVTTGIITKAVSIGLNLLLSTFATSVLRGTLDDRVGGTLRGSLKESGLFRQVHPLDGPVMGLADPGDRAPADAEPLDWAKGFSFIWG